MGLTLLLVTKPSLYSYVSRLPLELGSLSICQFINFFYYSACHTVPKHLNREIQFKNNIANLRDLKMLHCNAKYFSEGL